MEYQKVTQVLKHIFDIYGVEIVQRKSVFKAAVFDLLQENKYKNERIVLRNAIETDELLLLVKSIPVNADTAAKITERLKKSFHMTDEDTKFVICCFLAACGQNPRTVMSKKPDPGMDKKPDSGMSKKPDSGMDKKPDSGMVKKPDPGMKKKSDSGMAKKPDSGMSKKPDSGMVKKTDPGMEKKSDSGTEKKSGSGMAEKSEAVTKQKANQERTTNFNSAATEKTRYQADGAAAGNTVQQGCIFEAECKRRNKDGKLFLYKDKLIFNQYMKKRQIEICYDDISNISLQPAGLWIWYLFIMCLLGEGLLCCFLAIEKGEVVALIISSILVMISIRYLIAAIRMGRRIFLIRVGFKSHFLTFKNRADRNHALECIQNEIRR